MSGFWGFEVLYLPLVSRPDCSARVLPGGRYRVLRAGVLVDELREGAAGRETEEEEAGRLVETLAGREGVVRAGAVRAGTE